MINMKTNFNPENKENLTYGDILEPAMKITTKKDAKQYLEQYTAYIQKFIDKNPRTDGRTAESIAKENLGYWAGYYDNKTRKRVEKLFKCSHPYFGSIEEKGIPTAKEAFEIGKKLGEKIKRNEM